MSKELDKQHKIYTPLPWVVECHRAMDKIFGESWREQTVWDYACGDRNMTKWSPKPFSRLYSSDIDESVKPDFVYDMMELAPAKLPRNLLKTLETRSPLILFTNSPFGAVGCRIRKTVIEIHRRYKARIIYACITNVFMGDPKTERSGWFDNFWFLYGFMFNSREFPELKASWGCAFTIWVSKE